MVVELRGGSVGCTGVFVRDDVILTAGRCLSATTTSSDGRVATSAEVDALEVRGGGEGDLAWGGVTGATFVWIPGFRGDNIALVRTEQQFNGTAFGDALPVPMAFDVLKPVVRGSNRRSRLHHTQFRMYYWPETSFPYCRR